MNDDDDEPAIPSGDQQRGRSDFMLLLDLARELGRGNQHHLERVAGFFDDDSLAALRHQLQYWSTSDEAVRAVALAIEIQEGGRAQ